jgi:hypothetical protein
VLVNNPCHSDQSMHDATKYARAQFASTLWSYSLI